MLVDTNKIFFGMFVENTERSFISDDL